MGRTYDHGRAAFRSAATGLTDRVVRVINRFASAYRRGCPGPYLYDRCFISRLRNARGGLDRCAQTLPSESITHFQMKL
jgi:hypothetical protein